MESTLSTHRAELAVAKESGKRYLSDHLVKDSRVVADLLIEILSSTETAENQSSLGRTVGGGFAEHIPQISLGRLRVTEMKLHRLTFAKS